MGYVSSLLGSNVTSSYLHIDNIRNDLTTGKFWGAGGVKYLQLAHNDTNATITASSGKIYLQSGGTEFRLYESAGTHYLSIDVAAAGGVVLGNDASIIRLSPTTAITECYTSGTASRFDVYNTDRTKVLGMACESAGHTYLYSTSANPLEVYLTSKRLRLTGANAAAEKVDLEFYDATLTAWYKVYIDNGAWVIAAV